MHIKIRSDKILCTLRATTPSRTIFARPHPLTKAQGGEALQRGRHHRRKLRHSLADQRCE